MNGPTVRLDWSMKHPPVWAVINIALVVVAAAAAMHHVSIGWQTMVIAAAVVALVAMVTALALVLTGRAGPKAFGAGALVLVVGLWVLIGRVAPWKPANLGTLAAATVTACVVAFILGRRDKAGQAGLALDAVRQVFASAATSLAREWEDRIERVARIQGEVLDSQMWPGKAGFTMTFQPVKGGTTVQMLAQASARLAADAHLPQGCGVEIGPGAHRGQMVLRVSTVNALATEKPFPMGLVPASINDPIPIGVHRDTTTSVIHLRYSSGVLVGVKGSGKTNRLHVITAGLANCMDTLVWQIDLTGGLSAPWINPWLEGRALAPSVDWAASTVEEAAHMLHAAVEVINGRKPAYRRRMKASNDDKLPVGPDVPQIVIMVDELATLPGQLHNLLTTISDTGRSAGVQTMVCALRATLDYLPPAIKVQAAERVGMKMTSEAELAYLFGWAENVSPADAPYPGNGFVQTGGVDTVRPDMAYRITPNMIEQVVTQVGARRPVLDDVSVNLADAGEGLYTNRWPRYRAAAAAAESAASAVPAGSVSPRVARFQAEADERRVNKQQWTDGLAARTARAGFDVAVPEEWPTPPRNVEYPRSPAHERLLALLGAALPQGLTPQAIVKALADEGHGTERQTVHTWLGLEISRGTVRQPIERGPYYLVVQDAAAAD